MHKTFLRVAALLGAVTVALGAFGAHTLKGLVSDSAVNTFDTGVRYQFYHVFAIIIVAILYNQFSNKWLTWAGKLFIGGIILFSGSLYVLTFYAATVQPGIGWIGAITPIGGLLFIAGWICLFIGIKKPRA